jgi:hypothetical protein
MKEAFSFLFLFTGVMAVSRPSCADWLVMKSGGTVEVRSLELTERAANMVTLNGKVWSVIIDAVDVPATLAANEVALGEGPRPKSATGVPPPTPPDGSPSPARPQTEESREVDIRQPQSPPPMALERSRAALYVNGAIGTSRLEFVDARRFELFREEASIDTRYNDGQGRGVEVGGLFLLKDPLGVSASVELFRNDRQAAFEAFLPHPFFFDRFRELAGSRSNLSHEEAAVHLDAVFSTRWGEGFFLDISAGPSLFLTRTEVLVDPLYAEVFPFDVVVPQGAEYRVLEDRPVGFNVGARATYRVAGPIGVDFGVRFSRARVKVLPSEGRNVEFDAGGFRASAGLSWLFP